MIGLVLAAQLLAAVTPPSPPPPYCTLPVQVASEVHVIVFYAHEAELVPDACLVAAQEGRPCLDPGSGHLYAFELELWLPAGEWPIYSEGSPVAAEAWIDRKLVKRCGTRPSRIFWDPFETGDLLRWSIVR